MVNTFFNSNFFLGCMTLFAALVATGGVVWVYYLEQRKKKRDAAKLMLQEMQRTEIISEYKKTQLFPFIRKIIVTNSWATSVHHFVNDLTREEMDEISDLYSVGEYIDLAMITISNQELDVSEKNMDAKQKERLNRWKLFLVRTADKYHPLSETTYKKLKKIAKIKAK